MNENQFRLLPAQLLLRELAYKVNRRGFRSRYIVIVTTLIDAQQFPASAIAALYEQRWSVETNFKHLKTTMGMEVLHCETVDGVLREFYAFCLVYNLIRTVMLEAGLAQCSHHSKVSFVDALRWLIASCYRTTRISLLIVPHRPGRVEPHAIKRRPKEYDRLMKPRKTYQKEALRA